MGKWRNFFSRGQRASDHPGPAPVMQRRDPLLEAVIAREQIGLLFQPQIEPATGLIAGAEALARWNGAASPEQLFARAAAAGLGERLSRLIQRKALRIAGAWEGPLRHLGVSINLLPEDVARAGLQHQMVMLLGALGLDPPTP